MSKSSQFSITKCQITADRLGGFDKKFYDVKTQGYGAKILSAAFKSKGFHMVFKKDFKVEKKKGKKTHRFSPRLLRVECASCAPMSTPQHHCSLAP